MRQALEKKETNTKVTVIRPELNLERWPAIWTPAQSRSKPKLKVLERKRKLEDGSTVLCVVKIDPSFEYGNLTTEDQKVWYGLLELWTQAGRPRELIFSLRELARVLHRTWCRETLEGLKKSLLRLKITNFSWTNSYYDSTAKKTLEFLDSFSIISDLHLVQVIEGNRVNGEQCSCEFSKLLYHNLLNNYTKPIFFDTLLKIRGGIAQLLYKYLELVMNDKTYFERNSKELFFDEFGLEGDEYTKPYSRKRALLIAIMELNQIGVGIQNGFLELSLVKTKDKSDWKLTVKKLLLSEHEPKQTSPDSELQLEPVSKVGSLKEEILVYFLERFGLRRTATKAELEKAEEIIRKHQLDFEKAKEIIDFAKCAAVETNYKPKNFNGILQYFGEALERYQAKQNKMEANKGIKNCSFCNEEGLLGVIETTGRRATMRCPHDVEALKLKAAKWNIKFEFWSDNPPEFIY